MGEDPGPSAGDRKRAAAVAGHRGEEALARQALTDPAPAVRSTALGALGRLGRLARAELDAASTDPDQDVRARAAELCAALEAAEVLDLLVRALGDVSSRVTEAACFALGELREAAAGAVQDLSRIARSHRDPLCREAAVAALGAIGDPRGLDAILEATKDKPAVRRRAVIALAPFEGRDVDAALERALNDRDWQVRQAAEDLTGRLA